MQINSVTQQLLSPLGLDRNTQTSADGLPVGAIKISGDDLVSTHDGQAFHKILAKYDVTNISPRDFSELVQDLHDAGEINDSEFRELAKMRQALEQSGVDPDERLDLVQFFTEKLSQQLADFAASRGTDPALQPSSQEIEKQTGESQRQVEWINKFALINSAGSEALDLGA